MPTTIEHERMRWGYMTDAQLTTRLGRITRREKLSNFITLAQERGNTALLARAYQRAEELGYNNLVPSNSEVSVMDLNRRAAPRTAPDPPHAVAPPRAHTRPRARENVAVTKAKQKDGQIRVIRIGRKRD